MSSHTQKVFSKHFWKKFIKKFSRTEKILLVAFFAIGLSSVLFLSLVHSPASNIPSRGGTYREGIIGQPAFINPLYSVLNDPDRDLVSLIFSGLMKYNQNGDIVPDLAQSYKISDNGKVYEFTLKDNLFWQDGQPLTADDVVFTIKTIQNPACQSPLRASWFNIRVEKVSDQKVRFVLGQAYPNFLETATTKIIPQHIWEKTPAKSLALATASPYLTIGSGPFQFENIQNNHGQVESLQLKANPYYYFRHHPYLSHVTFYFFPNQEELAKAAQLGKIDGLMLSPATTFQNKSKFKLYKLEVPQYFAVFFNPDQSNLLAQTSIRKALSYGINKKEIVNTIFHGEAIPVESPLLPKFYHDVSSPNNAYAYNPSQAEEIFNNLSFIKVKDSPFRAKTILEKTLPIFKSRLEKGSRGEEVRSLQKCLSKFPDLYPSQKITGYFGNETKAAVIHFQEKYYQDILKPWGFKKGTGLVSKTTRQKLNEVCSTPKPAKTLPLEFTLTTVDQPQMKAVANLLKKQWEKIGVKVNLQFKPTSVLESEIINPRDYQALLFGETLSMQLDLFPFWDSSRRMSPGLNLALYHNSEADKLLESVRQETDPALKQKDYQKLQSIILNDAPAVFLYRPLSLYYLSPKIKMGSPITKIAESSQRFASIVNWYIKTK